MASKASGCQLCRVKLTVLRETRVDSGCGTASSPAKGQASLGALVQNLPMSLDWQLTQTPWTPIGFLACKEMRLNGKSVEFP